MMQIRFPFQIDPHGHTAGVTDEAHIRQLIEQVLFTTPGERVNRPAFGSGLSQLIFAPLSEELATTTEFMVQGALQQWLGDLVQVEAVHVGHGEATLYITIDYIVRCTLRRQIAKFERRDLP